MSRLEKWAKELRDPILVAACSGWVDAGMAGVNAVTYLTEQLLEAEEIMCLDISQAVDLSQSRPVVEISEGQILRVEWPCLVLSGAHSPERDVLLLQGPEPAREWHSLVGKLVDTAIDLGVSEVYILGGMPGMVTHRYPVQVLATVNESVPAGKVLPRRPDYSGPTGILTVLQYELGRRGIPAIGLWAQIPPYLASVSSAPGVRALLQRLMDLTRLQLDLSHLAKDVEEYREKVEEQLSGRPELASMIDRFEMVAESAAQLQEDSLPSGEEIASEIERFLRDEA